MNNPLLALFVIPIMMVIAGIGTAIFFLVRAYIEHEEEKLRRKKKALRDMPAYHCNRPHPTDRTPHYTVAPGLVLFCAVTTPALIGSAIAASR